MSEKRFTIKPQDDYWAVVDNYNEDKVCIINGIHTEIEAIWLCDFMNEQQATIQRFEEYVFSDERILCYNCLFCQEKDIYEVKCKIKGSVDVHGTCQYYEKKGV